MSVKIQDMKGVHYAKSSAEVETVLGQRYDGVNEFWLSHDEMDSPALAIVVNGELASLTYFPTRDHPGHTSVGNVEGLKRGKFSTFYINTPTEKHLVLNDSIVPVPTAINAAKEFLIDKGLPASVHWMEL